MAEAGWGGASSTASASPGAGVTYFGNYGNSLLATSLAQTTEANTALVHRGPDVTLKNLRVVVTTNGRGSASTWTTYKNGSSTSQTVSLTATGTYSDLTNTVSLTAGDTYSYALAFGGSSGALFIGGASISLESVGQAANMWSADGSVSTTSTATRYFLPTGNLATTQTVESIGQAAVPTAGTFSNLRVVASVSRATATTVRSRIAGANGNQTVSVTAAGTYEDITNTDTVTAGQLVTVAAFPGAGTDTLTLLHISQLFTASAARVTAISASPASSTSLGPGVTRYVVPSGLLSATSSESGSQIPAPVAGTAAYLTGYVSANGSTTDVVVVLRVAAVDTAVTFTIPAGTTGVFSDTTHSVAVTAGQLVSVKMSGGTTGNVTFRSVGLAFTADAIASTSVGAATAGATAAGVGASTADTTGTAVAGAVAAAVGSSTASAAGSATATVTGAGVSAFFTVGTATATVTASGAGASLVASTGTATATVTADASSPSTGRARRLVLIMA